MALEKFEYPAAGTVTDLWYPSRNPRTPAAQEGRDLNIAREISAGNKGYHYGAALHTYELVRSYDQVSAAERAAFENFLAYVGGAPFRFTDYLGVPWRVTFDQFRYRFQPVRGDRWNIDCAVRAELAAPPSLRKVPTTLQRELLFYAPLTVDLGAFGRWDVTPTSTLNPLSFVANGVTFDGGDGLSYLEAGHALPAQGAVVFACDVTTTSGSADAYQFFDAATIGGTTGIEIVSDANAVRARVFSGASTVASLTGGGAFVANTLKKVGLAWQANDFRLVVDGAEVATDSAGAAPTALHGTNLYIGQRSDASRKLSGHVRDLAIFCRALTSAELIAVQAAL